jgi:hypothetical protein
MILGRETIRSSLVAQRRIEFAHMLRDATNRSSTLQSREVAVSTLESRATEVFEQLDLADQTAEMSDERQHVPHALC